VGVNDILSLYMNKRRAIGFLRVSSDQQDVERQRRDVAAAARVHNLEITRTVALQDVSGTKVLANAEVRRVLEDLSRPDVAGVAISAVDRLVRPGQLGDLQIFDFFQRSKKLIFTPGQEIDVTTQAGFLTSGIMGVIAGFERQMILARTSAGKEIARQRGGNPNGTNVLPRGVTYSKTAGWAYVEPDVSRIRSAYDLLFERRSYRDIVARIGGGFTNVGIRGSLANPIWKGIRRYSEGREEPLELKLIDPPLISPEKWEMAQQIILEKRKRWAKTKHPQPRCLLGGLLRCARCGRAVYLRCCHHKYSYYDCASKVRGPSCGARGVQQPSADRSFEHFMSHEFLDPAFLRAVTGRFQSAQPMRDENAEMIVSQRQKLEAERQRLLRMTLKGACTEDDFARESKRIETEIRDLDRLAPAPFPAAIDPAKLVERTTLTFALFHKRPLEEKRDLLRSVLKEIILKNGSVTAITINGGFLDSANSQARS
jgi:DNA invertase Pin-like site-specific DNA recombinase